MENNATTLERLLPAWMPVDVFYALLGAVVFLVVIGVAFALGMTEGRHAHTRRMRSLQERRAELRGEMIKSRRRNRPEAEVGVNLMRKVVNRFKLLKSSGIAQAQSMMVEAGYRSRDAMVIYAFFSLASPVLFVLLGLVLMSMHIWGTGIGVKVRLVAPVALMYFGYKLPAWVVAFRRKKRYKKIQRALADTLDLMTICAEAGLSLGMALERVSRELGMTYPEMAEELALTGTELGFLPERSKALSNLAERVKLAEIRGITSVLIQTEKYGTPVAQAMRVLSAEFREQRMLRAENKAAALPAKMTVPVVCFILPTLFIVIIAPVVIKVMDSFHH